METKHYIIIYVAFAFGFEAIHLLFVWRKFKKKMDEPQFQMVKGVVMSIKSAQSLKKKIFNPFTLIFIGIPMLIIISPFLFPLTIISMIKKLLFGKSKLEKQAEAEMNALSEARRRSEQFMRTEDIGEIDIAGRGRIGDIDFKIDLEIKDTDTDDEKTDGK